MIKSIKFFSLFILICVTLSTPVYSAVWRVSNIPNSSADFTSIQTAHDSVAVNDTLYVEGSGVSYGRLVLTKTVYIYGPGYFLAENPNTQANKATARVTSIIFNPGSEGSLITGLYIDGNAGCCPYSSIRVNTNNIVIKRNSIIESTGDAIISIASGVSSAIIMQNYIYNSYSSSAGQGIFISAGCTNTLIYNNYINSYGNVVSSADATVSNTQVVNNVLNNTTGSVILHNATFDNNILRNGAFTPTNVTYNNNIGNSTQFDTSNGNQQNVVMTTVFVTSGSTDGKWQIDPAGPAYGAGLSGEDIGMFGGNDPYILSGIPSIPAIYYFKSTTSASGTSLPVEIKIKSHK